MAQIRPWFMPWRRPVHEEMTGRAAARAGYTGPQIRALVRGVVDNDLGGGLSGTWRRHQSDEAQPSHCLRQRGQTGPSADRPAVDAAGACVRRNTLAARARFQAGDERGGLFLAGKACHTVQDSYFHADREYAGRSEEPFSAEVACLAPITHVRRYLGPRADHDWTLDAGRDAGGAPSVHYRAAEAASYNYLLVLRSILNAPLAGAADGALDAFLAAHFRLAGQ